jgi:hypothetical protein
MTGEGMWTATVGAQAAENNSWGNKAADKVASRAPKAVERAQRGFKALLPDAVGSITGFIDDTLGTVLGGEYVTSGMVAAGYGAVSKERQSRIVIHTEKGTVLLGFAGTGDASRVRELEMRVGADSKPKSWWKSTF